MQLQLQVQVQDLGPDKIRNRRPHAAVTVPMVAGWADGRAGRVDGQRRVGPDEAWKEAHAQAWDSAGRVPGAWKTGLAFTPQTCSATRSF